VLSFASAIFAGAESRGWKLRTKTIDVLVLISIVPALPIVATWFLPWEKWIPKLLPKKIIGPYLIWCAFGARYFGMPSWLVATVLVWGIGICVFAILQPRNSK
jgi:hypothetical protein